ncbi:hypothetical protein GRF29_19g2328583 [Pseudopithomyces chartarum]|uniref:BHLH domain-containing protein n=1 Tax=Pseudopithomyces chartarum TaxID=1892770 RepID=A0AAN6RJU9_9PLEO|nr:hypothetical protein GRF29_19g2328583 [Pseudopithomyces chartarum]
MEFIDYSSFPILSSTAYSPISDSLAYPADPNQSFLDRPFAPATDPSVAGFAQPFDQPIFSTRSLNCVHATSPTAVSQPESTYGPSTFAQPDSFPPASSFDPTPLHVSISPLSHHSRTPSPYGHLSQDAPFMTSPPLSPRPEFKRELTDSSTKLQSCTSSPPKRKRGRPRLDRSTASHSSTSSVLSQRTQRLPHNQVERKYREGLNASLERLRQTVPALCQDDDLGSLLANPRPSKAMILEGAIDYIKAIEKDRDMYREENERLRRSVGGGWDAAANAAFLPDL